MHSGASWGIAINTSGNLVATASWGKSCRVYDIHLQKEVAVLVGHLDSLWAVKFSPSKQDLVGTVSTDYSCRLWNTNTKECLSVLHGHTNEVCFSPQFCLLLTMYKSTFINIIHTIFLYIISKSMRKTYFLLRWY